MARKKKDGRRAVGIQSKKGKLYIIRTKNEIRDGVCVNKKIWIATGLDDTEENKKRAIELRNRLLQNNNILIDRNISVPDYIEIYLDKKKRTVAETTYLGYIRRSKHIKSYFSTYALSNIKKNEVECFLDQLFIEKGIQPRSVKDIKILFGSIMEQAVKDNLISDNPVKEATINKNIADKYNKPKNEENFFSSREVTLFLEIAKNHPLYRLFFVTLFFGLRREEVLGLKWSCINFVKKEFIINHTVTKGISVIRQNSTKSKASRRTYPLDDDLLKIFEDIKSDEQRNRKLFGNAYKDNDYIFKHEDGSLYYPDYPTKAFRKLIRQHSELPQNITFHGLRVSCVSLLISKGKDVKSIQKWVGHADVETTLKIYAKVKEKDAKQEILNEMHSIIVQPKQ